MGLWTDIRDAGESILSTGSGVDLRSDSARKKHSGITGAANSVRSAEEGALGKLTGRESAADKRSQAQMVGDQIQAYKDQTALSNKALQETQSEKDVVKRQIDEKQIRALRGTYRPAGGFLNNQSSSGLGNQGSLSNKLGQA